MSEMVHEDVLEAIQAAKQKLTEAFFRGDAAGVAELYTDDCVFAPPDVDFVRGKAAMQQFVEQARAMGVKGPVFETVEAEQLGDLVIEVALHKVIGMDDAVMAKGKALFVWKRVNGEWKSHRDTFNFDSPPEP